MFNRMIGKSRVVLTSLGVCLVSLLLLWIGPQELHINASARDLQPDAPQSKTSPDTVATLELGQPIERELQGGQKHEYRLALNEGQHASVVVEQRGVDVLVRLLGPDGKQITELDDEIRLHGPEEVGLVATAGGVYKLSVEAKQQEGGTGVYLIRFTELRAATEKDRSLQEGRSLYTESVSLRRAGKLEEALRSGARAMAIQEELLGAEHPNVATSLNNLAFIHYLKGDYKKSETLHERALAIRTKALGPDHPHVAYSINNLAAVHSKRGEYSKATLLYERALEIKEKTQGPEHADVATSLNNLASSYFDQGDFPKAEQLQQRALQIREKASGPNHVSVASSLNNLGNVYSKIGDYSTAVTLHRRALEIRENALGSYHADVATSLNNLANAYLQLGDLVAAESIYQRSVAIREKALGPEHDLVATPLNNLAEIYYRKGDYTRAEQVSRRALAIVMKSLGPDNPKVASSLQPLAQVQHSRGEYTEAERSYKRALEIREKTQNSDHPRIVELLNGLSRLYADRGDLVQAVSIQSRANSIAERNIALILATGSERQKLAYLDSLSEITDQTISLHAQIVPNNPQARELAITSILQRKGRVLDVLSNSLTVLRSRFNAADQTLLDQLNDTTAHLAKVVLSDAQLITPVEQQLIKSIQEQREKLEVEISRRSAGSYQQSQPVTLAAIRSAIPEDAALIELAIYRPFDVKAHEAKADAEPHYIAYIIRRQGEVQWKDLGAAESIDAAIRAWRNALRDPQHKDTQQLARVVDERVMAPLRAVLGNAKHLLISPDGALNLIPFAALVDEQGRHLIQKYSFTYLTSGRDLLRMQVARASKNRPVVIADPSFGEPALALVSIRPTTKRDSPGVRRRSITTGDDLTEVYFAPLVGTAREASVIRMLFPDAKVLTGHRATEAAVKQVAAPLLMHIASHGFFLSEAGAATRPMRGRPTGVLVAAGDSTPTVRISSKTKIDNPLLRSGLALAGANQRSANGDDGILTALEASGLNLWGTKLVVLSACDTGVGEVRNGEGVYGLRRAFVLAGAESLVMSLWPVSDYTTRKLMTEYYKNLKLGKGRGDALREVQLEMLKRNRDLHPFYWANFIQSGEWANLDGKR